MLWFFLAGGLFAETIEILRLQSGGVAGDDWRLVATLWGVYGVAAFACSGLARLVAGSSSGRLRIASVLFGALVFLPWFNFDYFPALLSPRSLIGTGVTLVLVAVAAGAIARFPRTALIVVVVLGVGANALALRSARSRSVNGPRGEAAPGAPNIVVVLIDTLRADHVGTYGYARPTTPHIDRLAQDAVVFEQVFAQGPWTKPSVASLLTGTYVHRHGVVTSRDALGDAHFTLAQALRERGYFTAAFSANPWITREFGFDRGFDHFEGPRAMGMQLTNFYRLTARVQRRLGRLGWRNDLSGLLLQASGRVNPTNAERDRTLVEQFADWIASAPPAPFFVYVHLIGAHDPYDPPEEYAALFRPAGVERAPRLPPPRVQSIFERAQAMAEPERAALIAQYDGAVRFADAMAGRVWEEIERRGFAGRSVLVLCADHGEEFLEHGNWRHGNQMYQEVVRVPLIVRRPGQAGGQVRRTDPAMLVDLFPTLLGMAGGGRPGGLDGQNLFLSPSPDRPIYAEHWRFEGGEYSSRAVLKNGLKLIHTRDNARGGQRREELYELGEDPGEQRDRMLDAEVIFGDRAEDLRTSLASLGALSTSGRVPQVKIAEATCERLKALGYECEPRAGEAPRGASR